MYNVIIQLQKRCSNITKTINWKDISDINYAGARNGNTLKPLSERFCDNIILYYMVPLNKDAREACAKQKVGKVEYLSKFLAEYTFKIKRLLAEHDFNANKRYIKPTLRLHYQRSQLTMYLH